MDGLFEYVDFWPKLSLILYPFLGNLKTHVAIMQGQIGFASCAVLESLVEFVAPSDCGMWPNTVKVV